MTACEAKIEPQLDSGKRDLTVSFLGYVEGCRYYRVTDEQKETRYIIVRGNGVAISK